jgi:L-lactate dehydrogenase complex protein LldG
MISNQEKFIGRVRSALGHPADKRREVPELFPQQPSAESEALLQRIRSRTAEERRDLLVKLTAAAKPINLAVTAVADEAAAAAAVVGLVGRKSPEWEEQTQVAAWRHPLVDALDLGAALESEGIPLYIVDSVPVEGGADRRDAIRRNIIKSYIGITSADFVLADTATLVMRSRPDQPRSAAVVPSIHVAIVRLEQILADLKELYALLRWDPRQWESGLGNYMAFISGPSKTADIEATMVHGAHGPREVHIVVITGNES